MRWTTFSGLLAALGVCASCCLLPFISVSLGLGGAWVGSLEAFVPYKPVFIMFAAVLLSYGFYAVYRPTPSCAAGPACKTCRPGKPMRLMLWAATILAAGSILFDYLEPFLL
jgi:mercuric ion transport protein